MRHRSLTAVSRVPATVVAAMSVALALLAVAAPGAAAPRAGEWVFPVGPPTGPVDVVRGFAPPEQAWHAGHRGVDLAAPAGAEVRAAGSGRITYAGPLAGRGVVVVDHGSLRTTYEPVSAGVTVGDEVNAGDPIGTLAVAGSHCAPGSCLHWGAREGERYVDPTGLVRSAAVRLLPLGERTLSGDAPPRPTWPGTSLNWPLAHPRITSPYGMRVHPVTGVYKLHDGTDFGAACGTPVRASAGGTVAHVGVRGAYGLQVTVDHGTLGRGVLTTSYSHLSRGTVSAGQSVGSGHTIGLVGTSGSSTGCHLHFMVYSAGSVVDPLTYLPGHRTAPGGPVTAAGKATGILTSRAGPHG